QRTAATTTPLSCGVADVCPRELFSSSLYRFAPGFVAKLSQGRSLWSVSAPSSASLQFLFRRPRPFLRSLPSELRDNRPYIFPGSTSSSCCRPAPWPYSFRVFRLRPSSSPRDRPVQNLPPSGRRIFLFRTRSL